MLSTLDIISLHKEDLKKLITPAQLIPHYDSSGYHNKKGYHINCPLHNDTEFKMCCFSEGRQGKEPKCFCFKCHKDFTKGEDCITIARRISGDSFQDVLNFMAKLAGKPPLWQQGKFKPWPYYSELKNLPF